MQLFHHITEVKPTAVDHSLDCQDLDTQVTMGLERPICGNCRRGALQVGLALWPRANLSCLPLRLSRWGAALKPAVTLQPLVHGSEVGDPWIS